MKVDIISSGSKGNCAVIDDTIIIDSGWNCNPKGDVVLLTHNHSDHVKHLDKFFGLPICCTELTKEKLLPKFPYVTFTEFPRDAKRRFKFFRVESEGNKYTILPVELKHDVPCVGFDIYRESYNDEDNKRIFWATDFNSIVDEDTFINQLRNKVFDAIYIEGNNTMNPQDFLDVYFYEEGSKPPKDDFHRRKSYENHCNIKYLIHLFKRAGYSESNRFTEPVTLLHKSSYYYLKNEEMIVRLCSIANVVNPLY